MESLTKKTIEGWGPLPPSELLHRVQEEFAREYLALREAQPLATKTAVINHLLENPIWKDWGRIGSAWAAFKVLERLLPEKGGA